MKRTKEHITGEVAAGMTELALTKAGWAVDRIHRDYGEDLLVKPRLGDSSLDDFHLLVQVKGTSGRVAKHKDGSWVKWVDARHIERWLRLREAVIVVFWPLNAQMGRFCVPARQYTLHEILKQFRPLDGTGKAKPTLKLTFPDTNMLDAAGLDRLAWSYRLAHAAEVNDVYRAADTQAKEQLAAELLMARCGSFRRRARDTSAFEQCVAEAEEAWNATLDATLHLLNLGDPASLAGFARDLPDRIKELEDADLAMSEDPAITLLEGKVYDAIPREGVGIDERLCQDLAGRLHHRIEQVGR